MAKREFELLAPAGSFLTLKAVIEAGADAVYVGGDLFGARAYAENFSKEELLEAIDYVHFKRRQLYLTVNTLLKNEELEDRLYDYLLPFYERGLDAVLVQDFGVLCYIHESFPDLPIHTSTQMTITGVEGALLLKNFGVTRIVMAREMSLHEMQEIHAKTGMELEAFVHGALCYSYSGQCLFSSMLGGRSGNRGRCAQPCRLPYSVLDNRKKEYHKESYILSLKDLCGIENLSSLHRAGVFSLKIEGRMKQAEYAAGVVSFYRKYMDDYLSHKQMDYRVAKKNQKLISDLGNRCGFTNLYYGKHNDKSMVTFVKPNYETDNEKLHNDIFERYVSKQSKIFVNGYLYLHQGEEALLTVICQEVSVTQKGAVVAKARNKPLEQEEIEKRIRKTGDTWFAFDELTIDMEEDIFIPIGVLNQLRRDALEQLVQCFSQKYIRELPPVKNGEYTIIVADEMQTDINAMQTNINEIRTGINEIQTDINGIRTDADVKQNRKPAYIAAIEEKEQLSPVLERNWISSVYIDWNICQKNNITTTLSECITLIKGYGKECFLILPAISRNETMKFLKKLKSFFHAVPLDGFVVKTYEELYYVSTYFSDRKLIVDHNLYAYNDKAVAAFQRLGATRVTIPVELNHKEMKKRDNTNSEIIIYGYYPLMTSAQCVHYNTKECDKIPTVCYLKDRYQKMFPVKNHCSECYNIIYNSLPVMLFNYEEEFVKNHIINFRWNFTIESAEEIRKLFDSFEKGQIIEGKFTNGHYKRGVE